MKPCARSRAAKRRCIRTRERRWLKCVEPATPCCSRCVRDATAVAGSEGVPALLELGVPDPFLARRGLIGPPSMPDDAVAFRQSTLERTITAPSWTSLIAEHYWNSHYLGKEGFAEFLSQTSSPCRVSWRQHRWSTRPRCADGEHGKKTLQKRRALADALTSTKLDAER